MTFSRYLPIVGLALLAGVCSLRADEAAALNDFLGPYVTTRDGRHVNASAEYWTGVVGVPFDRDIDLRVPPTPLDLDLDRKIDTVFSADWHLKGGLLANPGAAGFIPTPDDPKGRVGKYSISTGFLGVREEMDPDTHQPTGRYGFNCWCCHASADEQGNILIGRPNTRINLGLIMSAARAMDPGHVISWPGRGKPVTPDELRKREHLTAQFDFDADHDGQVTIDEWRRAMHLPPARVAQAMMLSAGPGRLDQSVDQRMDGFIPLANLQQYWYRKRGPAEYLRMEAEPKVSAFNPVSIPAAISGLGVKHFSWTGKDSSMKYDAVAIATKALHVTAEQLADLMHFPHTGPVDTERLNRAMTLDFRDVGTAGRETDSGTADGWTTMMLSHPNPKLITSIPEAYDAFELRRVLTKERETPVIPEGDVLAAEGLKIFTERQVGKMINERVVYGREALLPRNALSVVALVPIDRSRPMSEKLAVRCATCHNYSPLAAPTPLSAPIPPMKRCDNCHYDHPIKDKPGRFQSLSAWIKKKEIVNSDGCLECHDTHPDFGPQVYSNSWLMPFDADGDGETQHDEAGDLAAGGIGTDAMLNIDSLFVRQLVPRGRRRSKTTYAISPDAYRRPEHVEYSTAGFGFVRVAPLLSLQCSAPYLHNGSVPTLEALLTEMSQRPARFRVGTDAERFEFDTSLPGNRNTGHEYGTNLTPHEKRALIHFLETLP